MKNYKNFRRLFEQEAINHSDVSVFGMQPEMAPDQEMPEMPIDYPAQQLALPAPDQTSEPVDPMTMTVRDFIEKCRETDPLVCMGIESFIEKNMHTFGAAHTEPTPTDPDLTFSAAVAQDQPEMPTPPTPAQPFSLDQSQDELNFPTA